MFYDFSIRRSVRSSSATRTTRCVAAAAERRQARARRARMAARAGAPSRSARAARRVFRRQAADVRPAARAARHGVPAERLGRALQIPYGDTTSYIELARRIGKPNAMRAVGAANGANPIAIIVPCHRVIGADGSLTGYGGGLPAKRWLLDHERHYAPAPLLELRS